MTSKQPEDQPASAPPPSVESPDAATAEAQSHTRRERDPLRVGVIRRLWLMPIAHCLIGVIAGLSLVLVWFCSHKWWRVNYDAETEPAVVASLRQYQIVIDDEQGRFVLQDNGREFRVADEPTPGQLGIGRLPGVRGALVDHATRLAHYNAVLRQRASAWRGLWVNSVRDKSLVFSLANVGIVAKDSANQPWLVTAVDRFAQLPREPVLALMRLFSEAVGARVRSLRERPQPTANTGSLIQPARAEFQRAVWQLLCWAAGLPRIASPPPASPSLAGLSLRAARAAVAATDRVQATIGNSITWKYEVQAPAQNQAVRAYFLRPFREDLERLAAMANASFERLGRLMRRLARCLPECEPEPAPRGTSGTAPDDAAQAAAEKVPHDRECCDVDRRLRTWRPRAFETTDLDPLEKVLEYVRDASNDLLLRDLYTVTLSETGFLWFFGAWKWLEIAWWAIFGVLVMGVFQIVSLGARGKGLDGARWEPRDALRVVGRIFYAPFVAIVFFWLAMATDLVEEKSLLASNTFGALAAAFVIGMAPNHLIRLLMKVLEVVTRGGENPDLQAEKKAPKQVHVAREPATASRSVPTVDSLRRRLTRIATAPLE